MRERNGNVGKPRAQRCANRALMFGVTIAEQEIDRYRAIRPERFFHLIKHARDFCFGERCYHATFVIDTLGNTDTVSARNARIGLSPTQIIGIGPRNATDQRDIPKTLSCQVQNPGAGALETRIGRDGRAEHEVPHIFRGDAGAVEGIEHTDLRSGDGTGPLGNDDAALLVDGNKISVGAPSIDSNPQHNHPTP